MMLWAYLFSASASALLLHPRTACAFSAPPLPSSSVSSSVATRRAVSSPNNGGRVVIVAPPLPERPTTTATALSMVPPAYPPTPPKKPPKSSAPIRNSGAVFGLFENFNTTSSSSSSSSSGSGGGDESGDNGKEWPVNTRRVAAAGGADVASEIEGVEGNVVGADRGGRRVYNSTRGEVVTVLTTDAGRRDGDADGGESTTESKLTIAEDCSNDGGVVVEEEEDPPRPPLAEPPSFSLGEEELDDIAGMLTERPPTLRQLRGGVARGASSSYDAATGSEVGLGAGGDDAAAEEAKGDGDGERDGGAVASSLFDRRARIKAAKEAASSCSSGAAAGDAADAAAMSSDLSSSPPKNDEGDDDDATAAAAEVKELKPIVAEESPGEKLMKEIESIDVTSSSSSSSSSIAADGVVEVDVADVVNESDGDARDVAVVVDDDDEKSALKPSAEAEEEKAAPLAPTRSIEEDYRQLRDKVAALEPTSAQVLAYSLGTDSASSKDEGGAADEATAAAPPPPQSNSNNPLIENLISSATKTLSSFAPAPPIAPPTIETIDGNINAFDENLSRINEQLRQKLGGQRRDLGKLRRKVNELQRELRRVNRSGGGGATKEDEGVEARDAEPISEGKEDEYLRDLDQAKRTIASLEAQEQSLSRELFSDKAKLEEALEAKERVAAEYNYVVNSYTKLKRSMDGNGSEPQKRSKEQSDIIAKLDAQLEEATANMKRYQAESTGWRSECTAKANQLDALTGKVASMQETIDELQSALSTSEADANERVARAMEEELDRSKGSLSRLSDEYELMLKRKTKRLGKLRQALNGANARKRRVERYSEKEKMRAVSLVKLQLGTEIAGLKDALRERDDEIESMKDTVKEAEGVKEEREQLLAEIMFLSKSFEELQSELAANAKMYEDCIAGFEKDAAVKDARIKELEEELKAANDKIVQLEATIQEMTVELEKERSINANLTSTVSELEKELKSARENAGGYDNIIAILRKEASEYKSELSSANTDAESYKQKVAELEALVGKTKESLIEEKKRIESVLEEKDTKIAILDRDLAERLNDIHSTKKALEDTKNLLTIMTKDYNNEKERANALDLKIQKLNELSAGGGRSSDEVDRLEALLGEITESNEEYKSLVSEYQSKSEFLSRQLLLSGQNMSRKQGQIDSLKEELSNVVAEASSTEEDQLSTLEEISQLKAKLDDVQGKSTLWKAQANGMIVELTNQLKEKEEEQLQKQKKDQSIVANSTAALQDEIAQLKSAMEQAQSSAKERMKQKNQSIKELEDTVASLKVNVEDLQREKEQVANRLEEEIQRGKDVHGSRELQVKTTEERLAKEYLAAIKEMENGMNETIHQLKTEIQALKKKEAAAAQTPKVIAIEEELRRSKENEVSLISQNMKMQHQIQDLQLKQQRQREEILRATAADDGDDDDDDDDLIGYGKKKSVDLPKYYKEKQRPVVVRLARRVREIFRRKKNLV